MASKRRNMFCQDKMQERTEIEKEAGDDGNRSLVVASFLVCILCVGYSSSRHAHRHERSRMRRQYGHPTAFVWAEEDQGGGGGDADVDDPNWEPWSQPGPCSRTCGGGVTSQTRTCREGYSCRGSSKRYFSCNIQDCGSGKDFRSEQCAEYNKIPFEEVFYDWIPYTKAPNKCALNCMPRGERFYYRHKDKVEDGTRCDDESLDVCVDGVCRPVGCDKLLGSSAQEDLCRVCGGDGSDCNTHKGILDDISLQVGYNDLLLIPSGSTNIKIREIRPSNNYLAVRNITGHYYLNGNWRIDFPRSLRFAGTVFHYGRKPHGFFAPESITAIGPTNEAIYIVLLFQEANPGVEYEYSLPTGKVVVTDPEGYVWQYDEFSECSTTCGGGYQSRRVWCSKQKDPSTEVSEDLCDGSDEPAHTQTCASVPCPPQWTMSDWSMCSVTCGEGGSQIRQISCEQVMGSGQSTLLNDSACTDILGAKPATTRPCPETLPCPGWHLGPWKSCDRLCGDGKQRRAVHCFRRVKGKVEIHPDLACSAEKPPSEKDCNLRPCEGVDWVTSDWSGCEHKCGLTFETRTAHCMSQEGKVFADGLCHAYRKPALKRNCSNPCHLMFQWYASQWSECSSKCSEGVQSRQVYCGAFEDENFKKAEDSKCDPAKRYNDTQPCKGEEECKGEWYIGPFGSCSKPCGGGDMQRKVLCFKDNAVVNVKECKPETTLFASESCNTHSCGADEIMPVEPTHTVMEEDSEECEDEEYEDEATGDNAGRGGDESGDVMMNDMARDAEFIRSGLQLFDSGLDVRSHENIKMKRDIEEGDVTVTAAAVSSAPSGSDSSASSDFGSSTSESSFPTDGSSTDPTETSSEASQSTETLGSSGSTGTSDSTELSGATEVSETSGASEVPTGDTGSTESSLTSASTPELASSISGETADTSEGISTDTKMTTSSGVTLESDTAGTDSDTAGTGSDTAGTGSDTAGTDSDTAGTDSDTAGTDSDTAGTESDTAGSDGSTLGSEGSTASSDTGISSTEPTSSESSDTASTDVSPTMTDDMTSASGETSGSPEPTSSADVSDTPTMTESTETEPSKESSPTDLSPTSESTTDMSEESSVSSVSEDIFGVTSPSTIDQAVVLETKMKRCKPKRKTKCMRSEFGCCADNVTLATGPFGKGCPTPTTCEETKFGCCPDGVSPASGEGFKDCPPSQCELTLFGCCPDGVTEAEGNDFEGCPQETTPALLLDCASTQFGCCPDGIISATGPNFEGCMCEGSGGDCDLCKDTDFGCCPDGITAASGPDYLGCDETESTSTDLTIATSEIVLCADTAYGCCDDNVTAAGGPEMDGCPAQPVTERPLTCNETEFGCCPDGVNAASGPSREGCAPVCSGGPFGCCRDNVTLAHGLNGEGCCLNTPYGCCPDNILSAQGPNLEGCGCEYMMFGCCPDNATAASGPDHEGCGCRHSAHGCCPDGLTQSPGPHFEGCPCYTFQFGCCPDGETRSRGPHHQGCGCEHTEFGCCPDNKTPAKGPAKDCTCEASKYGCCPDGVTLAEGEDFEGCTKKPVRPGEVCTLPKDRGPCREFSVKWFFDMEYGGCSRFWYGSCEGNGNRFKTQEDCRATCVEAKGRDACYLPKIEGPCKGYYQAWYYNAERKQCGQFIYGGCLGNNNRFQTREECDELCVEPDHLDACEQDVNPGPCNGTFPRWYYDKRSQVCRPFNYGGCKPNKNNFLTESACQVKCMRPGTTKAPPTLDICGLPKDVGPCKASITKWYYDPREGDCKHFVYGGCRGNANQFWSKSECLKRCQPGYKTKEHCSLSKSEGNCNERLPKWYFDRGDNRCKPFYYSDCGGNANRFDSRQECEADCPPRVARDTCLMPAEVGGCHDYVERYYFDSFEGRCKLFYYGGCGGNDNNFETETDCQRRCDAAQVVEKFTHEMCFLPDDRGPCSDSRTKWYYDSRDGVCKQFDYGGCQGNGNRFNSRQDCEHSCGRVQDVCSLPVVAGPCQAFIEQWYFDHSTGSCERFNYGGCQGNGNRFESVEQCEARCRRERPRPQPQPATAGPPTQPAFCREPVDPGPCLKQLFYWYYDSNSGTCQEFMYGGCEGNANRFYTEEQCERQCGAFRGHDVCSQERDSGPCTSEIPKWYFDMTTRTCQEFVYGNCEGNSNRFSNRDECHTVCLFKDDLPIPPAENTPNVNREICSLPPESGYCSESHSRWYFDTNRRTCFPFNFTGCSGNLNNFKTQQDCRQYCEVTEAPNEIDVGSGPEKERCKQRLALCQVEMTRCEYGIERWIDEEGCDNCRCHNPCATAIDCEPGTKCVVSLQTDDETGDSVYRAICRPVAKPGECPDLKRESCAEIRNDCNTDADCATNDKCCYDGCGKTCATPVMPHEVNITTTTLRPGPPMVQPPEISPATEPEVEAEEGNFVSLRCIVTGFPAPTITWIRGTVLFNNTAGKYRILPQGVLQIIGLVRSDSGVYVCTADNGIGPTIKKEFHLTVKEGVARPASVMGDEDSSVLASLGGAATLHCLAIGFPRPAITWWRGSRIIPLNAEGYEQRRDNSLFVGKVTLSDLGYYTCQAYNGLGRAASWSVALKAYGPPGLVQDPNDISYNQFLVEPPPGFYRPQPLPEVQQPGPQSPPTTPTTTTVSTTQRPTVRTFVVPVKASIVLDETVYKVGADVSIPCDVEGYPVPKVVWYMDGEQIQVSDRIRISESNRLMVLGARIEDSGMYRCHARNDYGEDESAVAIKVEGTYIDPKCTDNQFFANCQLIVQARYCMHKYYAKFCCKSCTEAGQLPSQGPHLYENRRRRRSPVLLSPPPLVIERLSLPKS